MNPIQLAQQIKHKLQTVTWPKGSRSVVFGTENVYIVAGRPSEGDSPIALPFALVSLDNGTPDPTHPGYLTQSFRVMVAAHVAGDRLGEVAIAGCAVSDLGKSAGRGVGELMSVAQTELGSLTGADGARLQLSLSATGAPSRVEGFGVHVALGELTLTGMCTSEPHYAEPQGLKVNSTTWTWRGEHCKERYDFLQFSLGYRSGSPAQSPDDPGVTMVDVTTSMNLNHPPVPGQFYSLWADYNSRSLDGGTEGSSDGSIVGAYVKT